MIPHLNCSFRVSQGFIYLLFLDLIKTADSISIIMVQEKLPHQALLILMIYRWHLFARGNFYLMFKLYLIHLFSNSILLTPKFYLEN